MDTVMTSTYMDAVIRLRGSIADMDGTAAMVPFHADMAPTWMSELDGVIRTAWSRRNFKTDLDTTVPIKSGFRQRKAAEARKA